MIIWIFIIGAFTKQMNALFAGRMMIPYSTMGDARLPVHCKEAWKLHHENICNEYTDEGTTKAYYLLLAYRMFD